jgi:hypothetical protein|tara:strand:+ start:42264 stop:42767 length:504 start_codon:yes stop_codon:yes gene_type:complete
VLKRAQGFSAVGVTVTLVAITVIAILIQPMVDRWKIENRVKEYIVTLERAAEDAELYYQANCLESPHTPSLSDFRSYRLMKFASFLRSPWSQEYPIIQYENWGGANPRVNISMANVPVRYLTALNAASEHIVIQGNNAIYNRSISFSYDEQQQSLMDNRRLFEDDGC